MGIILRIKVAVKVVDITITKTKIKTKIKPCLPIYKNILKNNKLSI